MVALWMLFGLATGALFALAGALLEPVLIRHGRAVRWLWVGLLASAVALLPLSQVSTSTANESVTRALATRFEIDAVPVHMEAVSDPSAARTSTVPLAAPTLRALVRAWFAQSTQRLEWLDRPLLTLWATGVMVLVLLLAVGTMRGVPAGPAAVGVLRPRVLLPPWILDLDPPSRALVLRHEREHLAARDPLLLVAAVSLVGLFPWHAPLWYLLRRLRSAIEVDCDARVLRDAPDVRRYASLLLLVGAHRDDQSPLSRLTGIATMRMTSGRAALQRRIEVMTQPRRAGVSALSVIAAVAAASTATAALLLPAPRLSRELVAQVPPARTSVTPAVADSAVVFRYAIERVEMWFQDGQHQFLYRVLRAPTLADPNAGFTTIRVNSVSGRPLNVMLYVERPATQRATKMDTARLRTPFEFTRSGDLLPMHIRSVEGDSLQISSPVAVAPLLASTARGVHFVIRGDRGIRATPP